MNRRTDYTRLRTLEDVRNARNMLNREIASSEQQLKEDYEEISRIFSLEYWIDAAGRHLSKISMTVSSIYSGYQFISSFIRKQREAPSETTNRENTTGKKKLFRNKKHVSSTASERH